jgi:cell wall-associated NlpC family hydrolase
MAFKLATESSGSLTVEDVCRQRIATSLVFDCSGFVRAVATDLGIEPRLTGQADDIMDQCRSSSAWGTLKSGEAAATAAADGYFVIAGLKANEHVPAKNNGHVVVIIGRKPLYHSTYPYCYGGSLTASTAQTRNENGQWVPPPFASSGNKSVGEVWGRGKLNPKTKVLEPGSRDKVQYFKYLNRTFKAEK